MQEAIPFRTYCPGGTTPTVNGGGDHRRLLARDPGANITSGQVVLQGSNDEYRDYVQKIVSENSIIVFGKRGCCMCHVVKRLLLGLGVNPMVYEVDDQVEKCPEMMEFLRINGDGEDVGNKEGMEMGHLMQFPVVFVGGKLFGGLERVIATHISGELVPILKDAGALWL